MYELRIRPFRVEDRQLFPAEPFVADSLAQLRDQLIEHAMEHKIDISDHYSDQIYAARPWRLDADEQAPDVRDVDEELLLLLTGAVFGISPGQVDLRGDEDSPAADLSEPESTSSGKGQTVRSAKVNTRSFLGRLLGR